MKTRDLLPEALLFDSDGHLSEVAVTSLADGQSSIIPEVGILHFEACDHCSSAVGDAALLSLEVHQMLTSVNVEALASRETARARVPVGAVSLAAAVALLATTPVAYGVLMNATARLSLGAQLLEILGHVVAVISRGSPELSQMRAVVSYAAGTMLLLMGCAVARTQSHAAWK